MPVLFDVLESRLCFSSGQLDPTFGAGGVALSPLTVFPNGSIHGMAVQSDGKIIAAGDIGTGAGSVVGGGPAGEEAEIARFNSDCTLDTSFGNAGRVLLPIANYNTIFNATVLEPDGSILLAGNVEAPNNPNSQILLARYNADGSPDTAFGINGVVEDAVGQSSEADAMAVATSGAIIIAGASTDDILVARYTPSGQLDPSFGTDGVRIQSFVANYLAIYGVAIQQSGNILVGVNPDSQGDSDTDGSLAEFTSGGVLDTRYGKSGFSEFGGYQFTFTCMALQRNGSVVLSGTTSAVGGAMVVAGVLPDGRPDSSYGPTGWKSLVSNGSASAIKALPDGKTVIAGFSATKLGNQFVVVRLNSSGSFDPSFARGGILKSDPGEDDELSAVAVEPDGRIIAGGTFSIAFNPADLPFPYLGETGVIVRYTAGGEYDRSFGAGGETGAGMVDVKASMAQVALQSDGKILVAENGPSLARYLSDGSLDATFGHDGQVFAR